MYAIDVIALARSSPPGLLTYRSRIAFAPGTIVSVTLRRTPISALVVSCESVRDIKAQLKAASFVLSKSEPKAEASLPPAVFTAAEKVARYHAAPIGSIFFALLREAIHLPFSEILQTGSGYTLDALETSASERREQYSVRIAETLARSQTAVLIVPTIAELEAYRHWLKEFSPLTLSALRTPAKRLVLVEEAVQSPRLIIATPAFLWLPIPFLGLVILDRISAGTYTDPKRPYIDWRVAARELAHAREVPLVFGDSILPLEYRPLPDASLTASEARTFVLDARRDKGPNTGNVSEEYFKAVPPEARALIQKTLQSGGRAVVLAARKGYAPQVVCRDCGTQVRDSRGVPFTFTTARGKRVFRTTDGRTIETAHAKCDVCESWNLVPLGIGVERVEEELHEAFPDALVVRLDADTHTRATKVREVLKAAEQPGSILVGTEFMLPWLLREKPFELALIASADSLLALPFWRTRERFVRVARMLAEHAERLVLVTRRPDDSAVSAVAHPETTSFFSEEFALRRAVGYPPFGTLIALSFEASREKIAREQTRLMDMLREYTPRALTPKPRSLTRTEGTVMLQLPEGVWPDPQLSATLSQLPPSIRVRIDPESF